MPERSEQNGKQNEHSLGLGMGTRQKCARTRVRIGRHLGRDLGRDSESTSRLDISRGAEEEVVHSFACGNSGRGS